MVTVPSPIIIIIAGFSLLQGTKGGKGRKLFGKLSSTKEDSDEDRGTWVPGYNVFLPVVFHRLLSTCVGPWPTVDTVILCL